MIEKMTFAEHVLRFNERLSHVSFDLPVDHIIINPFKGDKEELVRKITTAFYNKYYNDTNPRRLILGSSPARRGSAVTGVPFEDAKHLQSETGVYINKYYVNRSSSGFLYDVIREYGGCTKFYSDFYMNFVCPLGIARINQKGNEVNCNYYESKKLQRALYPFIISAIHSQIGFGVDTSVCYCIGSGENFKYLLKINEKHNFFKTIFPLEHPRFIMQYKSSHKDEFIEKYICSLRDSKNK